jgi:hypothetical protein
VEPALEERLLTSSMSLIAELPRYRDDLEDSTGTHEMGVVAQVSRRLEAHLLIGAQLVARERGEDLDSALTRMFGGAASAARATSGQLAGYLASIEVESSPGGTTGSSRIYAVSDRPSLKSFGYETACCTQLAMNSWGGAPIRLMKRTRDGSSPRCTSSRQSSGYPPRLGLPAPRRERIAHPP